MPPESKPKERKNPDLGGPSARCSRYGAILEIETKISGGPLELENIQTAFIIAVANLLAVIPFLTTAENAGVAVSGDRLPVRKAETAAGNRRHESALFRALAEMSLYKKPPCIGDFVHQRQSSIVDQQLRIALEADARLHPK